jgi:hypothetical protein
VVLNTNVVSFQIVFWKNSHFQSPKVPEEEEEEEEWGKNKKRVKITRSI